MRARAAAPVALAATLLLGPIGCTSAAPGVEATKELEAEIAVALDMLRDLRATQNRMKPDPADSADLARVDRHLRAFVAKQIAPSAGADDRPARLERTRDLLLTVINDTARDGARTLGLPAPTPTTVETLRSAVKARP
jgi:hypothetical protein